MDILAWDTSTSLLSLALVRINGDTCEVLATHQGNGNSHSSQLAMLVASSLKEAGLLPGDLDLFAVGRGPGSFTGLRTGLALAKGLGLGASRPVLGLSSLLVMAAGGATGLVAPIIDARHNEIFTALFEVVKQGAVPELRSEIMVLKPALFYKTLADLADGEIVVTGAQYLLPERPQGFLDGGNHGPKAWILAKLAAVSYQLTDPEKSLTPLYGRSPDIFKTWQPPLRLSH